MYRTTDPTVWTVLHIGVGRAAEQIKARLRAKGLACTSCGEDVFRSDNEADGEFGDAAGCKLCVACYIEAGELNAHSDGHHDRSPSYYCPICVELGQLPIDDAPGT